MATLTSLVRSTATSRRGDPLFLRAFEELEAEQLDLRARMNGSRGIRSDQELREEVARREPVLVERLTNLAERARDMSSITRAYHLEQVRGSRLVQALREAPFFRRILDRPKGYPGDAEMMRFIYRARPEGPTPFGRFFHLLAVCTPSARAVRNRRQLLLERILGRPGSRVLSLGCGPADEILGALRSSPAKYRMTALDHDLETLLELRRAGDPRLGVAVANAFRLMAGDRRVAFPRLFTSLGVRRGHRPREPRGFRALLMPLGYRVRRLPTRGFDLVYSAGLFDYIRPDFRGVDAPASALARELFDLVAPGGELLLGNFSPVIPAWNRFALEFLCDWHLQYRTDAEVEGLAQRIDATNVREVRILREEEGVQTLLSVTRRS